MSGNKRLNMQKTSESPLILNEAPGNRHSSRIELFLHGKNIPRNFYDLANLLKFLKILLRRLDSNQRPQDYETCKLPLLYRASDPTGTRTQNNGLRVRYFFTN